MFVFTNFFELNRFERPTNRTQLQVPFKKARDILEEHLKHKHSPCDEVHGEEYPKHLKKLIERYALFQAQAPDKATQSEKNRRVQDRLIGNVPHMGQNPNNETRSSVNKTNVQEGKVVAGKREVGAVMTEKDGTEKKSGRPRTSLAGVMETRKDSAQLLDGLMEKMPGKSKEILEREVELKGREVNLKEKALDNGLKLKKAEIKLKAKATDTTLSLKEHNSMLQHLKGIQRAAYDHMKEEKQFWLNLKSDDPRCGVAKEDYEKAQKKHEKASQDVADAVCQRADEKRAENAAKAEARASATNAGKKAKSKDVFETVLTPEVVEIDSNGSSSFSELSK